MFNGAPIASVGKLNALVVGGGALRGIVCHVLILGTALTGGAWIFGLLELHKVLDPAGLGVVRHHEYHC